MGLFCALYKLCSAFICEMDLILYRHKMLAGWAHTENPPGWSWHRAALIFSLVATHFANTSIFSHCVRDGDCSLSCLCTSWVLITETMQWLCRAAQHAAILSRALACASIPRRGTVDWEHPCREHLFGVRPHYMYNNATRPKEWYWK